MHLGIQTGLILIDYMWMNIIQKTKYRLCGIIVTLTKLCVLKRGRCLQNDSTQNSVYNWICTRLKINVFNNLRYYYKNVSRLPILNYLQMYWDTLYFFILRIFPILRVSITSTLSKTLCSYSTHCYKNKEIRKMSDHILFTLFPLLICYVHISQ